MAGDFIARIKHAIARAEYVPSNLLREIERELHRHPSAELWILFGDAIQLSDRHDSLEEVERSYRRALELDPSSADAHESLGHYLFAVKADTRGSLRFFQRALELGAGVTAREGLSAAVNDLAESEE